MLPTVTDLLKRLIRSNNAVSISKDWVMSGRPCSPRLLFVFEGCRLPPSQTDDSASASRSHRQVTLHSLLSLEQAAMFCVISSSQTMSTYAQNTHKQATSYLSDNVSTNADLRSHSGLCSASTRKYQIPTTLIKFCELHGTAYYIMFMK